MYVCICHGITEHDLREQVECGAVNADAVAVRCGAGTSCGKCSDRICDLLRELQAGPPVAPAAARSRLASGF